MFLAVPAAYAVPDSQTIVSCLAHVCVFVALAGPCNLVGLETAVVSGAGADMTNNYVTVLSPG